jgi:hypothetical protein
MGRLRKHHFSAAGGRAVLCGPHGEEICLGAPADDRPYGLLIVQKVTDEADGLRFQFGKGGVETGISKVFLELIGEYIGGEGIGGTAHGTENVTGIKGEIRLEPAFEELTYFFGVAASIWK